MQRLNNNSSLAAIGGNMVHLKSEKILPSSQQDYAASLPTPSQLKGYSIKEPSYKKIYQKATLPKYGISQSHKKGVHI